MIEKQEDNGTVELQLPFQSCTFGFALFHHKLRNVFELCMVDAGSTKILLVIGEFATLEEVQTEYRHFVDTFTMAMRRIEWGE